MAPVPLAEDPQHLPAPDGVAAEFVAEGRQELVAAMSRIVRQSRARGET